jgi:hypothetical protein
MVLLLYFALHNLDKVKNVFVIEVMKHIMNVDGVRVEDYRLEE